MIVPMRYRVRILLTAAALSGALLTLAYAAVSNAPPPRGQAADLGLPNFAQVSTNLYRGAQPEAAGFDALARMGVQTVINLRRLHDDDLRPGLPLRELRVPMRAEDPELADVKTFLRLATTPTNLPAFVHCRRGADRTGLMVASYRVVVQGWDKPRALEEMKSGGYAFFPGYRDIVTLIEQLDAESLRAELGLPTPVPLAP
jgi:tyrosine-protein phosphatase SIW14